MLYVGFAVGFVVGMFFAIGIIGFCQMAKEESDGGGE